MHTTLKRAAVAVASGLGGATISLIAFQASAHALANCNGCVDSGDIANGAVQAADIATGAVRTQEISNGTVSAVDIGTGQVRSSEIANDTITGADVSTTADLAVGTVAGSSTVATGTTGSHQTLSGDMTYEGAAGGTSYYHAGVMGNFMGDTLTNSTASLHAGVVGSYNVTTSDANPGAQAGVAGEVGDGAVASGTSAVMAVLGGDSGALTPDSAYGVQYFNSTAGSHFTYGLDLFHAATTGYTNSAVEYGTADIRLSTGVTISTASGAPSANCVRGSIYLRTDGAADTTLYVCGATNTWTANGTDAAD